MSEASSPSVEHLERLLELTQRSAVKIETNAKGMAQVKITVCAGESEAEMQRLSQLARTTYIELQQSLGRITQFSS
jgi:rare lipoprotein A (peptidoglycan hydrolase)